MHGGITIVLSQTLLHNKCKTLTEALFTFTSPNKLKAFKTTLNYYLTLA